MMRYNFIGLVLARVECWPLRCIANVITIFTWPGSWQPGARLFIRETPASSATPPESEWTRAGHTRPPPCTRPLVCQLAVCSQCILWLHSAFLFLPVTVIRSWQSIWKIYSHNSVSKLLVYFTICRNSVRMKKISNVDSPKIWPPNWI